MLSSFNNLFAQRLLDLSLDLNISQQVRAGTNGNAVDQQHLDTTTPTGRLLFQITGAFAEYERGIIRERIKAGLQRATAQGKAARAGEGGR